MKTSQADRIAARWWNEQVINFGDGDTFTRLEVLGATCAAVLTLAVLVIGSSM